MTGQFKFLESNRFWALVFASAGVVLLDPLFSEQPWYMSVGKFAALLGAGFTTVGTFDRTADKKVEAAQIVANSTDAEATKKKRKVKK